MNIALIPARGGSKRVPRKNLETVGGMTLVEWAVTSAKVCGLIDKVVVSSEDDEILSVAGKHGVGHWKRSVDAATDDSADYDVVQDFLNQHYYQHMGPPIALIVYLRPTTPLRRVQWLDDAINQFLAADGGVTGLRSVHEMSESAHKCFEIEYGFLRRISPYKIDKTLYSPFIHDVDGANLPNHQYPKTYQPNGAVDIIRPDLVKDGVLYGDRCMAYETPWTPEIDTKQDLRLANMWYDMNYAGVRAYR